MAKKKVPEHGDELNMDLSPMIDMVFLLLIFFIVVSTQAVVQIDPNVKPTIASSSVQPKEALRRIVINVFPKDGEIVYTNEGLEPIEKSGLQEYIEKENERLKVNGPCTMHMRVDRRLSWKDVIVVQEASAGAGVNDFVFASYAQNP